MRYGMTEAWAHGLVNMAAQIDQGTYNAEPRTHRAFDLAVSALVSVGRYGHSRRAVVGVRTGTPSGVCGARTRAGWLTWG
jgi:hypothetical protein